MKRGRKTGATGPVSAALRHLVAEGALAADARQAEAAALLDGIAESLIERDRGNGLLAALLKRGEPLRGAYLYGEVGRGKTLLMDLFYGAVPIGDKKRLHFHEFMDEMHAAITKFRASPHGRRDSADPVAAVVKPVLGRTRLLCLDEFRVDDITNAMLLGRLFEKLFAGGLVLVTTSNVAPDELYENGLNRELFLPFLDLLKANTTVFALQGPTDYRRLKFEGQQVYHIGAGPAAKLAMDQLWARLTAGVAGRPEDLHVLGRTIRVPEAAMGVARFAAADLIDKPLGARDFLRLAHAYDVLILDDVPQFDRTRSSAAKRFILLLDALYDAGVKLGASFAAPIDGLGADDKTAAEFKRAASRLAEMQSAEYLAAPRKRAGEAAAMPA
ncbi:MAG: cell division protein ZapE [Devosia sp.]|nr:cell division protein ZapE [Devosia sp.]